MPMGVNNAQQRFPRMSGAGVETIELNNIMSRSVSRAWKKTVLEDDNIAVLAPA
jgi:hypothetical protein